MVECGDWRASLKPLGLHMMPAKDNEPVKSRSKDYDSSMTKVYKGIVDYSTEGIQIFGSPDGLLQQNACDSYWTSTKQSTEVFQGTQAVTRAIIFRVTSRKISGTDSTNQAD